VTLINALKNQSIDGKLWVVQRGRFGFIGRVRNRNSKVAGQYHLSLLVMPPASLIAREIAIGVDNFAVEFIADVGGFAQGDEIGEGAMGFVKDFVSGLKSNRHTPFKFNRESV
jgi:hypothetical protein